MQARARFGATAVAGHQNGDDGGLFGALPLALLFATLLWMLMLWGGHAAFNHLAGP